MAWVPFARNEDDEEMPDRNVPAAGGKSRVRTAGISCPADGEPKAMRDNLATDLGVVRQARIAFSHHSVGVNILAGIERLDAGSAAVDEGPVYLSFLGLDLGFGVRDSC